MSWQLIARSFAILRRDPKLLLFPVFSGLAGAAIVALYSLSPVGQRLLGASSSHAFGVADAITLLLAYWSLYFVVIFFNCALAACAQATFSGTKMSVSGSLAQATSRLGPILVWSLLSATIGVVTRAINERAGLAGRIAAWLFAATWNLATFLVIPVLIIEDLGAIESLRRSCSLLRKTWGEQLTVGIGIGWISLILSVPGLILGVVGANNYQPMLFAAMLYFVTLLVLMTAIRRVFDVALYRYATTGNVDGFPPDMLNGAFVARPRR